jgi:hypothetical protein
MALPKRAASARTTADEELDQGRQADAHECPRTEEVHEVDRPHARDGGPVEPGGEAEESKAEAEEDGEQGPPAGPVFTNAGHGGVSLADVPSLGTEPTEAPTSRPVPHPP